MQSDLLEGNKNQSLVETHINPRFISTIENYKSIQKGSAFLNFLPYAPFIDIELFESKFYQLSSKKDQESSDQTINNLLLETLNQFIQDVYRYGNRFIDNIQKESLNEENMKINNMKDQSTLNEQLESQKYQSQDIQKTQNSQTIVMQEQAKDEHYVNIEMRDIKNGKQLENIEEQQHLVFSSKANLVKYIVEIRALKEYLKLSKEVILCLSKQYDHIILQNSNIDNQEIENKNEISQNQNIRRKIKGQLIYYSIFRELSNKKHCWQTTTIQQLLEKAIKQEEDISYKREAFSDFLIDANQFYAEEDQSLLEIDWDREGFVYNKKKNNNLGEIITQGNVNKLKKFIKRYSRMCELLTALVLTLILPIYIAPVIRQHFSAITTILSMTIPLAFFLGIAIGGNDICNSMGTAYGCQAISMKQALILGVIFESLGALTLGANVSKTISGKILDINSFLKLQNIYALNMPAVLAAAAFSSLAVTIYGLPVSITQGVVFGMAAVGITSIGWSSVQYTGIGNIMIALIFSPFAGVLFALGMYYFMIKVIKQHEDSYKRATQFLPIFGFFNVFVVVFMVMYKGIDIKPLWIGLLVAILVGLIVAGILYIYGQKISKRDYSQFKSLKDEQEKEIMTGKIFKPLLIISACCVSFTHGSNDVSNCVGPLASVLNVYKNKDLNHEVDIPFWTLLLGASAFSIGICLIGKRTIKTMGKGVTSMIPMKACTVQMGTATAILIASAIGMPVSTSHCTIGSLLGATLAEKLNGLQFTFKKKSIKKIFASWIYTIPFVFLIAIYIYYALKGTIIKIEDYV